jgi:hypothetical protein
MHVLHVRTSFSHFYDMPNKVVHRMAGKNRLPETPGVPSLNRNISTLRVMGVILCPRSPQRFF